MEVKFTPTFYVSCHVKEPNLYALLCSLEAQKVGNVEVRPIAPPALMLPAPGPKMPTQKQQKLVNTLAGGKKKLAAIAAETNTTVKSASQMLLYLIRKKVVRRVGHATYELRS